MYMIAQHPDIERRLREEVFDKVGPSNIPMYENMREMRYLRAFLNGASDSADTSVNSC
jgi:hypothetical protein